MRRMFAAMALLALAMPALAQTAEEWVARGDAHSAQDDHVEAVAAYEKAIEADPARRATLLTKMARQLLWSDQPRRAAVLLSEHLVAKPEDCEARNDHGLALAWSDATSAALAEYQRVIGHCPAIRNNARLRAAMAARWLDLPSLAERLYLEVEREGSSEERIEARVGLAHVLLMRDATRRARMEFEKLEEGASIPAASEGAAIASVRLGDFEEGSVRVDAAAERGALSRDMRDLGERIDVADRLEVRPSTMQFRDADGTTFSSFGVGISRGWRRRGRGEIAFGRSELSDDLRSFDATWFQLGAEHRVNPSFAGRVSVRRSTYESADWTPISGEAHVVWTPSDELRVDGSVARLLITDNAAAIEQRLSGDFLSLGADRRLTYADTVVASLDCTRWNAGNARTRVLLNWRHQFEGVPRWTVEWPTVLQFYDEPFSFALFSPERYVETGPGLNVYRRFGRVWNLSAYARAGAQREDDAPWRALGVARVAMERDLRDRWAMRAAAAWSNSNLSGSGGFRRSSLMIEIAKRF